MMSGKATQAAGQSNANQWAARDASLAQALHRALGLCLIFLANAEEENGACAGWERLQAEC